MLLIFITLIGAALRFYNLMWGNGYFFNPDEGNMASSITQMCFEAKDLINLDQLHPWSWLGDSIDNPKCSMNPNFFAYGQFPLYLAYFSAQIQMYVTNLLSNLQLLPSNVPALPVGRQLPMSNFQPVPYPLAIFWLRFWSALASTLTILLVFFIVKMLTNSKSHINSKKPIAHHSILLSANNYPYAAAILTAFIPGLIQSAHFGTTEVLLTLFFILTLYLSIRLLTAKRTVLYIVGIALVVGAAFGTKITAAAFFVAPGLAIMLSSFQARLPLWKKAVRTIALGIMLIVLTGVVFFITSPYSFLDFKHFRETSTYETSVATGESQVFYTRQFKDTVPILFQLTNVFPYTLGYGLLTLGIVGIILLPLFIGTQRNPLLRKQYIVLIGSFLVFLGANCFLFVKWTRFATPTLPFFIIFGLLALYLFEKKLNNNALKYVRGILGLVVITTMLWGLSFFSIYAHDDVRYTASEWIYENIPKGSYLLFETGNVVDIPLNVENKKNKDEVKNSGAYAYTSISFDYYGLDEAPDLPEKLVGHLEKADYIFIPSRRVFANHMRFPNEFPILNRYYQTLLSGTLGFEKVAEFDSFPTLVGLDFPDEQAEETWTVFDHPVIRIYKKIQEHPREYYEDLLMQ